MAEERGEWAERDARDWRVGWYVTCVLILSVTNNMLSMFTKLTMLKIARSCKSR